MHAVSAQEVPGTFREAVSINVETQVVKTLETAREHVIEGQWEPAVVILQELIDSHGDTLVPVEPGRYSNTSDYCHLLISRFPSTGLETYRARVDPQAREWYESGQEHLDEAPLVRLVNSAFNSSYGDDALWLLGELAFERGQFALARQYWSLLVPSYSRDKAEQPSQEQTRSPGLEYLTHPDPTVSEDRVLTRLVLCSLFEGDRDRAQSELAVCQQRFPDATGELAGREGTLVNILSDLLAESAQWPDDRSRSGTVDSPGGRPDRIAELKPDPSPERLLWHRSMPPNRFEGPTARTAMQAEQPSPFFPLVHEQTVYVCGPDSVFAFNAADGSPRWPVADNDDSRIYTTILERPVTPHLPSAGLAWYTLCVSDGYLYARMGPPLLRRSRNEGNSFSEIIGLDIARREGELAFHVTSDILDPEAESAEATSWSFEGTPVVSEGRVYVSARRGFPEDETIVACFDAGSSRLLWKRRVCASLRTASDRFNLLGQNLLTLGDGRLFLNTGMGAIAALDTTDGRLIWVVTYESTGDETTHELSDARRHGLAPCVFYRGIVYAAPRDSRLLYALDATTGQPIWTQPFPDQILHMAGVVDGRLILCGHSVWAVDARTGRPAWPEKVGFADPAGRGFGRPALSQAHIYWPTRDEILRIDHRNGRITGRILLREEYQQSGGNLVIADGRLIVAQPDGLIALGSASDSVDSGTEQPIEAAPPVLQRGAGRNKLPNRAVVSSGRDVLLSDPADIQANRNTETADTTQARTASDQEASVAGPRQSRSVSNRNVMTRAADVWLWPAKRSWKMPLSSTAIVQFPNSTHSMPPTGPVVIDGSILNVLDPDDGSVRWSASTANSVDHVAAASESIAFATRSAIVVRNQNDGRLLWRRVSNPLSSHNRQVISAHGSGHFLLLTDRQVALLHAETGAAVWEWPEGHDRAPATTSSMKHLPADWLLSPSQILFRPAGSLAHVLLNQNTGKILCRGVLPYTAHALTAGSADTSMSRTVIIGQDADHRVRFTQLQESQSEWTHRTSSATRGPAFFVSHCEVPVLIENRQFAVRLDLRTGQQLWRRPISPVPLNPISGQFVTTDSELFCISEGVMRAFSLEAGTLKWQHYLGSGTWTVQIADDALICLQNTTRYAGHESDDAHSSIIILDPEAGHVLQKLRLATAINHTDLSVQSTHCFVRLNDQLIGLQPWPVLNSMVSTE